MNIVIEEIYNIIEALMITWFVTSYFKTNNKLADKTSKIVEFVLITIQINIVSILGMHWIITLIISSISLFGITTLLLKGSPSERLIISSTAILLLALSDISSLTLISKLLGIEYNDLVVNSSFTRLLSVLTAKLLYIIAASFILFFKKKYNLYIRKREAILIISSILLSGIQISLIRNVISDQKNYYNVFLIVLLCVIILNVILYYAMICIGKKNADEKNYSLMQKQLELQSESIQALKQKYDETAKIRHDIKNYLSLALGMAEQKKYNDLVQFLETLSDEKINSITSYINTKRSVLGAVLNSKLSKAKSSNIDMQCYILSELESVSDMDLGILFANLLDNAIEACEKNNGQSEIIVKTWTEAGYYFLEICNTVESDILSHNPKLETDKANSGFHGVGLRSVKDIVKKYDGMLNFDQRGNIFHVYVSLEKNVP